MNYCNGGSSYRLQFFQNCSFMCPLLGLQSFSNEVLHCGFLQKKPALPWAPLHGLRFWLGVCSCMGLLVPGKLLLWHLEHLLPLVLHWPQCLQGCFPHIFSLFLTTAILQHFFFFNFAFTRVATSITYGLTLANGGSYVKLPKWHCLRWGSSWSLIIEAIPPAPPATKTRSRKLDVDVNYSSLPHRCILSIRFMLRHSPCDSRLSCYAKAFSMWFLRYWKGGGKPKFYIFSPSRW